MILTRRHHRKCKALAVENPIYRVDYKRRRKNRRTIGQVYNMAKRLLKKFHLEDGWEVRVEDKCGDDEDCCQDDEYEYVALALTDFQDNYISFKKSYALRCDTKDLKDDILHEIAHVLVGCKHGHNRYWKKIAKEIGASPTEYKVFG